MMSFTEQNRQQLAMMQQQQQQQQHLIQQHEDNLAQQQMNEYQVHNVLIIYYNICLQSDPKGAINSNYFCSSSSS